MYFFFLVFVHSYLEMPLSSSIAAVGKDGLARNPAALCAEEAHQRRNVLDVDQPATESLTLVESNSIV